MILRKSRCTRSWARTFHSAPKFKITNRYGIVIRSPNQRLSIIRRKRGSRLVNCRLVILIRNWISWWLSVLRTMIIRSAVSIKSRWGQADQAIFRRYSVIPILRLIQLTMKILARVKFKRLSMMNFGQTMVLRISKFLWTLAICWILKK